MNPTSPTEMGSAPAAPSRDTPRRKGALRFSSVEFLVVLVLFILISPFLQDFSCGDAIESLLLTVVLLSAVVAVGGRRRTFITAAVLVAPAVAGKWVDHFRPGLLPPELSVALGIVFVFFITAHLLIFVIRAPRVNLEVLCAAISVYLMLGILWALGYVLVEQLVPGSFVYTAGSPAQQSMEGFQALYFSLQNLYGAEYGDIMPLSNAARILAISEAAVSLFYLTVLIARLVGAYSSRRSSG